jgi:hypothetical protein
VLENSPVPEEPLFLLSPTRTPDPSPSLHVPDNPTSPIRKRKRSQHTNAFICAEAERETDSEEHGDSDENYDGPSSADENDEDRAAVGDFQPTQQAGYEQQAVYLRSMLSQQAPTPFKRRDRLTELLENRYAKRLSSEPDAETDNYTQDSFVVDDDIVSWASSASDAI